MDLNSMADTLPTDENGNPTILTADNIAGFLGQDPFGTDDDLMPDLGSSYLTSRTFHAGDGTETRGDRPKTVVLE